MNKQISLLETGEEILNAGFYVDRIEKTVKRYRRHMISAIVAMVVAVLCLVAFSIHANVTMLDFQKNTEAAYNIQRSDLIAGLYSTNKAIVHGALKYSERMELWVKKAKAIILEFNSNTDMAEQDINDFLTTNYELAELYTVDPWICFTFARVESWFNKRAVSKAGAMGILQIMPETMAGIMGSNYYMGCEFNVKLSVKAWYRIYLPLVEIFRGDLKWIAISYLGGSYYPRQALAKGISFEDFMQDFKARNPDCWTYPYDIEKLYLQFKG